MAIRTSAPVLAALALLTAGAVQPASAAIKCWTNNEGVRECGETVPPEFAQQGHAVIKESGVVTETERAKTPEELAEAERKMREEAEAEAAVKEKARQDSILLATFSTIEDIERVRDEQVTALEATISVTKTRNAKIQEDLDKRIAAAAAEERAGKSPNEALLKDIDSLRRQVANNENFIDSQHQEQDEIRALYDGKIQRFKELKGL